jgi:hypothetical protein
MFFVQISRKKMGGPRAFEVGDCVWNLGPRALVIYAIYGYFL